MKKIAVNTVKAFLKEYKRKDSFVKTYTVEDSSFDVTFRTKLSVDEKTIFINRVLQGCFDSAGDFRPEYAPLAMRATFLQMCTNLPAIPLKNVTSGNGAPALDFDAMDELYKALDLDHLDNSGFRDMAVEMNSLCWKAIEWKKNRVLSAHNSDTALRDLLETLAAKVESVDTEAMMRYAGVLSSASDGLEEGGILKGLLQAYHAKAED